MKSPARDRSLWKLFVVALLLPTAAATARGQDLGGTAGTVAYIDSAVPMTQFRQRFEAVYNINRSDRAEYIYQRGADPRIDYQDLSTYLELAFSKQFSGFVEIHEHFVNPTQAPNASDLGDMNVGFKWAALYDEGQQIGTFQTRVFIPTGNPLQVLGAGHASIEPAFLFFQRLSERWLLEAEVKDWIPLSENGFAGNILNWGVGLSYQAYTSEQFKISPVVEVVGWNVLGGQETVVTPDGVAPDAGFPVKSAAGDTIVNAKVGVRFDCGPWGSLYAGYGRALTGAFWYKDMVRLEYRLTF